MVFEKHRWADLLLDVPADTAMGMGNGSFPLPLELRQSIAQHLENLGFALPVQRLEHVLPSEDPMVSAPGWRRADGY